MNPEEIQETLRMVAAARAAGHTDREIDSAFKRNNIPFSNVRTLERVARNLGVSAEAAEERRPGRTESFVRSVLQGATASLGSDFLAGMERIGARPEGSTERFREDLSAGREDHPIASMAGQVAGTFAGAPGAIASRAIAPAMRGAGNLAARGGAAVARAAGRGPLAQVGAAEAARGMGAAATGGLLGAAEGGAVGFGEAAGSDNRAEQAKHLAAVGGLLGAPIAGGLSAVRSSGLVRNTLAGAGPRMVQTAEKVAENLPTRRAVAAQVKAADDLTAAAFQQARRGNADLPGVAEMLLEDPTMRRALRSSGSQEASKAYKAIRDVANGVEGATLPRISFQLAEDMRNELKRSADAFARRQVDASGRVPGGGRVREAGTALDALDEVLEGVPGFSEGIAASRAARTVDRAYQLGVRAKNQPAEIVEDVLGGTSVRRGKQKLQIANTPEAREAFRAGVAEPYITELRSGKQSAMALMEKLSTSLEDQAKLRAVLGGDAPLRAFMQEAEHLVAVGSADKIAGALVKAAGFLGFGTSLFGAAAGYARGRGESGGLLDSTP